MNVAELVKGEPGRRQQRARATRRRILDAAEKLFVRDGYAATTISAIAEEGDVAVQTVYAVFGTKRAILAELVEVRTVGDDQPIPVRDHQDWQAMERETDARVQLAELAAIATRIAMRIAALYEVMAGAAGSDPEIAVIYQDRQRARYQDQLHVAESLAAKGALRSGLSAARACDIMWTLASPRTYHALAGERGWSADEFGHWLADVLASSCLEPADPGRAARAGPFSPD
jgi:TetR/AcrR family transcriptional regulator, regulator of autoinduction and epiphytic fitness